MLLTKIQALCKKKKYIKILEFGGLKFLSAGTVSAYIGDDAEGWTSNDCAVSMGIPEEARSDYIFPTEQRPAIDLRNLTQIAKLKFSIKGDTKISLIPFMLPNKQVLFIDSEKFKIFDEVYDPRYYFGRLDEGDENPKLIITSETFPVGIIEPEKINLAAMKKFTADLHKGVTAAEKVGFFDAGGQMEIEELPEAESEDVE